MKLYKPSWRQAIAYAGGLFVGTGLLMMIPKSPLTLIVIGGVLLFMAFVSIFDEE